jgi:hypothetical protein
MAESALRTGGRLPPTFAKNGDEQAGEGDT